MPHDKNGRELKEGDIVNMQFKVREVSQLENYCNCSLESVLPLYPGNGSTVLSGVNTRQVELFESAVVEENTKAAGVSLEDVKQFQQDLAVADKTEDAPLAPSDLVAPVMTHAQLNQFVHDLHARLDAVEKALA